jgi:hypothetical protein
MKKVKIKCDYSKDLPDINISVSDGRALISEHIEKHLKNLNYIAYKVNEDLGTLKYQETPDVDGCLYQHLDTINDYQELLEQIITYLINDPYVELCKIVSEADGVDI